MINKISSYTPSEEKHPLKTITGYDFFNCWAGKLTHKHKKHMRSFFAPLAVAYFIQFGLIVQREKQNVCQLPAKRESDCVLLNSSSTPL